MAQGHSYSRCKVKFNPGRADNMIIQAICLLDQLDKVTLAQFLATCPRSVGTPHTQTFLLLGSRIHSIDLSYLRTSTHLRCEFASGTAGISRNCGSLSRYFVTIVYSRIMYTPTCDYIAGQLYVCPMCGIHWRSDELLSREAW